MSWVVKVPVLVTLLGAVGTVAGSVLAGSIAKRIDPAIDDLGRSVWDGLTQNFPDNLDARRAVLSSATRALEKIALAYESEGDLATNQEHRKIAIPFRKKLRAWTKKLRADTKQTLKSEEIEALQNAIYTSLSEGLSEASTADMEAQRAASTQAFRNFVVEQLDPPQPFLDRFDGKKETRGFFAAYAEMIARELKINSAFHSVFQDQVLSELRSGMVELLRLHNSYLRTRLANERDAGLLRIDDVLDNPGVSRNRPTSMVMAKYRLVDYVDVTGRLAELMEWAANGALNSRHAVRSVAGRMYVGSGGLGKTRTLMELSDRLDALDWNVVWVAQGADPNKVWRALEVEAGASNLAGLLVVVDYAETKQEALGKLCEYASRLAAKDGPAIRIVAVSRHAGGWWDTLLASETGVVFENTPIRFSDSTTQLSLENRTEIFENARDVFQSELEFFGLAGTRSTRPNLASDDYARPLSIMFGAYLAARGERLAEGVNLLKEMVEQERLGWQRYIGDATQQRLQRLERVVPPITFIAGGSSDLVLDIVRRDVAFFGETSEHIHQQTLRDLIQFYGESDRIGAIEPDILGEAAIAYFALEEPSSAKLDWLVDCIDFVCQPEKDGIENSKQVIEVFIRALSQNPDAQVGQAFLRVLSSLQNAIQIGRLNDHSVAAIHNSLPLTTSVLADFSLVVNQSLLSRFSEEHTEQRAGLLSSLSIRLGNLNRREEALAAANQAVALFRTLVCAGSDEFKPQLADSLNNLGIRLNGLGQREAALAASVEAVDIFDALEDTCPGKFTPNFAMSLNNLSVRYSKVGRREDAVVASQKALELHRRLVSRHSDAYTPELAMNLHNLSSRLGELGRPEEALAACKEAVDIYSDLASLRPDSYKLNLATSLDRYGGHLSEVGRREEALKASEDAVKIHRELASRRLGEPTPNFAMSLSGLSNHLSELGRQEEALAACKDAVDIYRKLACSEPDVFNADFATCLNNFSNRLWDVGRREDALEASIKAVELLNELAISEPDAFRPSLARCLTNLSHRFSAVLRPDDAFAACDDAVKLFRELASSFREAFTPELANALSLYGECLRALGRLEDAIEAYVEAARLLMPYVKRNPDRYASLIMQNASDLVDVMTLAGRTEHQIRKLAVQLNLVPPYLDVVKAVDMEQTWTALRNRGEIEFAKIAYRELVTFLDARLHNQELDRIRASVGAVLRTLGDDCPYTPPPKQSNL